MMLLAEASLTKFSFSILILAMRKCKQETNVEGEGACAAHRHA
jgi:hypothetical protein